MAEFSATVYQNEFLPDGGTDVSAIVTVTCAGAGSAGQLGGGEAGEIIIVDTSGSMGRTRLEAAKVAAAAAVDQIDDGTWFAVIAGAHQAYLAFPSVRAGTGMVKMDNGARHGAHQAISMFRSDGGTAMGTWLTLAGRLFDSVPFLAKKHAILLTDGENHNETPEQLTSAILGATGKFQCDCRGVGVDWEVSEVRRIAQALLGTVDIVPQPDQLRGRVRQADQRLDEPRGGRRPAAGLGSAGGPGGLRPPGLPHRGGPHRPPGGGQPVDRRLSHRLLG